MSAKIIGGEYAIDLECALRIESATDNKPVFSCGRSALKSILDHAVPDCEGTVMLPDHICRSVPETVRSMGLKASFYHIREDFLPDLSAFNDDPDPVKALMIVNYFGMMSVSDINMLIREVRNINAGTKIILDNVQNYFGMKEDVNCDYAFTSYRKWFPVPDGASAIHNTGDGHTDMYPESVEKDAAMPLFSRYKLAGNVLKNFRDLTGDSICLELLDKGEQILSEVIPPSASGWTMNAMEELDLEEIRFKRKTNAKILHHGLQAMGIQHLYSESAVPLFVPIILASGRDDMRRAFFSHSVFCPVHWSEEWKTSFDNVEKNSLSDRELSLICDQRYGEEEMLFQLEILKDELTDH